MNTRLLVVLYCGIFTYKVNAQQLVSWSSFYETGFIWNPALTARYTQWELSGTHRQEWVGYDDAPEITTISFQLPFYQKNFTSSCGGAYVERDMVGPFENYTFSLAYAYKFRPKLLGRGIWDELSIGFSAKASKYQFNRGKLTFFDSYETLYASTLDESYPSFTPNLSIGVNYSTRNAMQNYHKSYFFCGIAAYQLIPSKLLHIDLPEDRTDSWDITSQPHIFTNLGYRHYIFRSENFIEYNLMAITTMNFANHAMASFKFETGNQWWISGGAVTNGEIFVQTGVIFGPKSKLKKIVKDGKLRIGIKGDFHAGKLALLSRTGYELYMAYTFETEK